MLSTPGSTLSTRVYLSMISHDLGNNTPGGDKLMTEHEFDRVIDRIYNDYMCPGDSLCIKVSCKGTAEIGYIKYSHQNDTVFICSTSNCLSFGSTLEKTPRTQQKLLDLISLYCEEPDQLLIDVINGDKDAARQFMGRRGNEIGDKNPFDFIREIEMIFKRN